ncbi:collagen alpha-1(I) chain-like [Pezoporus occidentalis]|uniref:collagen alpha-1(I) chain-like n=1 Tax=Pezoporus occidentalis TaxID=407982 RepID=UPI002F918537
MPPRPRMRREAASALLGDARRGAGSRRSPRSCGLSPAQPPASLPGRQSRAPMAAGPAGQVAYPCGGCFGTEGTGGCAPRGVCPSCGAQSAGAAALTPPAGDRPVCGTPFSVPRSPPRRGRPQRLRCCCSSSSSSLLAGVLGSGAAAGQPGPGGKEEGPAAAGGPTGRRCPGGAAGERPRRFSTGAGGRGLRRRRLPGCPTRLRGAGGGAAPVPGRWSQSGRWDGTRRAGAGGRAALGVLRPPVRGVSPPGRCPSLLLPRPGLPGEKNPRWKLRPGRWSLSPGTGGHGEPRRSPVAFFTSLLATQDVSAPGPTLFSSSSGLRMLSISHPKAHAVAVPLKDYEKALVCCV